MSQKKTTIAIIGAGFSGLASAWYLSLREEFNITLFDPGEIGENASGISAGLLHPFSGQRSKKPPFAIEALNESLQLMKEASKILNIQVMQETGLLRPALTPLHESYFQECASKHPEALWLSSEEMLKKDPNLIEKPGLFISCAYQVDTELYLKGLWKGCSSRGVQWEKKRIESLQELASFDATIVATGAALLPEIAHLPIHPVKGQLLIIDWNSSMPYPVNPGVYLVRSGTSIAVGATYEHNYASTEPDLKTAIDSLMPRVKEVYPHLPDPTILNCKAALRASTPSHLPLIGKVAPKTWILSGMGSKGLLYHAFYAKKLITLLFEV